MKTLILYVFHEYNDRVQYFIDHAIFHDPFYDFLIIRNDDSPDAVPVVVPEYVTLVTRPNIGFDFGGWSFGLLTGERYKNYDFFLFVNSSVKGPFLSEKITVKDWPQCYIEGLTEEIKLFGSTINTVNNPLKLSHVQSYIFCTDRQGLDFLIHSGIFSIENYEKDMINAIGREIQMSRKIIEHGWNIGCLYEYYKDIDFRFLNKKPEDYDVCFQDDIMYPENEGKLWNKEELVFIKQNRYETVFSKPHCVMSFRWISTWIHVLYYLTNADPLLEHYHVFLTSVVQNGRVNGQDLLTCVSDFYDYFVDHQMIRQVDNEEYEQLLPNYGSGVLLPLHKLLCTLSERDLNIFRVLTIDVYLSIIHPELTSELGR